MRRRGTSVTFVVMAGGRGDRLWPLVRERNPKVCLSPDGTHSLLRATVDRLRPVWPHAKWLIVTTAGQAESVRANLPPSLRSAVLVEPQIKNTAACITLSAVALAIRNPHEVMVVVPADHWVSDAASFQRAVRAAIRAAVAHDTIAMIGIAPTHPHPGLGYLCAETPLEGFHQPRVFRLAHFIEKPSRAKARQLLKRPRTYWNSGMFIATADRFLEGLTEWLPDHTRWLAPLANGLHRHPKRTNRSFARRVEAAYRRLKAVSFDHGVMDHVQDGVVVEGEFSWADLGSWDTWAILGRAKARTITVDSERITVVGQGRHLVAAIGVKDLLVVHTPTATLICPPDRAQDVREIVRRLATDPALAPYR